MCMRFIWALVLNVDANVPAGHSRGSAPPLWCAGMFDPGFSRRTGQENSSSTKITQTGHPGYILTINTLTGAEEWAGRADNDGLGEWKAHKPTHKHEYNHREQLSCFLSLGHLFLLCDHIRKAQEGDTMTEDTREASKQALKVTITQKTNLGRTRRWQRSLHSGQKTDFSTVSVGHHKPGETMFGILVTGECSTGDLYVSEASFWISVGGSGHRRVGSKFTLRF